MPNIDGQITATWPVEHIVCPLVSTDARSVIRELAALLSAAPGMMNPDQFLLDVEERETQSPTYLGGGIAIPHARTSAVSRIVVAVGQSRHGIGWGSHRELARLVLLVGVPRDEIPGYLEAVRRITQTVRRIDWIEQAMACKDAATLSRLLQSTIEL